MSSHSRAKLFSTKALNWFILESNFTVWFTSVCYAIQRFFVANDSWFLATPNSPAIEKSYNVVANNVMFDIEHHEMEFAYDMSDAKAVRLSAYRDKLKSLLKHCKMSSFLDIRFSAGEDSWIRAAIGVVGLYSTYCSRKYRGVPGSVQAYRTQIWGESTHLGKECVLSPEEIRQSFPMFDEFVAVRRNLDPSGVFANPHFDEIFGASSLACTSSSNTSNSSPDRQRPSVTPSRMSGDSNEWKGTIGKGPRTRRCLAARLTGLGRHVKK
jgi:hypothetical protein